MSDGWALDGEGWVLDGEGWVLDGWSLDGWSSDADVALHVQSQVIGAREGSLAHLTLEGPVSGVLPIMAGQLVRSGKFPSAILPGALVRLLARVGPQMSLQVRRFGVGFRATGVRASVRRQPLATPGFPAAARFLAVGRWMALRRALDQRWMLTPLRTGMAMVHQWRLASTGQEIRQIR